MTERSRNRAVKRVPHEILDLLRRLHGHGHEAYLVGGAVRSLVLGSLPKDFDVATSASPDEVAGVFRRVIPTGVRHGTVTVLHRGRSVEVTTFRTEGPYSDGRRPDRVAFVGGIGEDLGRRDFTMNAMALQPLSGEFLDPYGGEQDLAAGLIRAIGDPTERFAEDALRMLRALRFAAQLGFAVEERTLEAIAANRDRISGVSAERVRDEITRILESPLPARALRLMHSCGLLALTLPELAEGAGVEQRGGHLFDVLEHSIRCCEAVPAGDLVLRLAALLHDVGKPRSLVVDAAGERRFHGHDRLSAQLSEELLRRLKYPTTVVQQVSHLVRHHMFGYSDEWSDAAVRRFVARVGEQHIDRLVALRRADSTAQRGEPADGAALVSLVSRVDRQLSAGSALTLRDLAVNGTDLMEAGIPAGPALGTTLEHLLETVLDDPDQNNREQLLRIAARYYRRRIAPD